MKSKTHTDTAEALSRIPRGMRGLKCFACGRRNERRRSHPARDAWIEMLHRFTLQSLFKSHPARDAWIEIVMKKYQLGALTVSHPARDAWIEMFYQMADAPAYQRRIPRGMRGLKFIHS